MEQSGESAVDHGGVVVGDENRLKQIITNLAGYVLSLPLTVFDLNPSLDAETLANSPPPVELSRSLPSCSIPIRQRSVGWLVRYQRKGRHPDCRPW